MGLCGHQGPHPGEGSTAARSDRRPRLGSEGRSLAGNALLDDVCIFHNRSLPFCWDARQAADTSPGAPFPPKTKMKPLPVFTTQEAGQGK